MSQMKSKSAHMGSRLSLLRVSCLLARLLLVCPHSSGRGRSEVSRHDYRTLNETVLFEGRFRSMVRRRVLMPDASTVVDFDVVLQKSASVLVFVWDRSSATTTLIQEYHPGIDRMMVLSQTSCGSP